MGNVGSIQTAKGEIFTNAHVLSQSRAGLGYFVLSGCDVNQSGTPGMSVVVDSGYIQCGWGTARKTVAGGTLTVTAAHATLHRIDVVYVDINGTIGIYDGNAIAISPTGKSDFKQMSSPSPGTNIPSGVILALIYVSATDTSITNAEILDIATYGPYVVESPTTTTTGKIPYWSSTTKTLSDGYTVGTTANCLVQLDSSARIPAVSGALLTNTATTTILATPGDTLVNSGGTLTAIAKGTTGQSYVQGANIPAWTTRVFNATFSFGDGSVVILPGACSIGIPIASKITAAYIRSFDIDGGLKTGSVTCTIYVHDLSAAIGTAVDTISLSSTSSNSATGKNITVAAGKWITVVTSGITTVEQIVCSITLEAT